MRLKNRIGRLEKQMRELRCAWCSFSLFDVAPPLPFLPNTELCRDNVLTCCWRCGTQFNVSGDTLRERQIYALFYSTPPARVYTDERARAVFAYVIRLYMLHKERAAQEDEKADENYHEQYYRQKRERQTVEKLRALLTPKARARAAMHQRAQAEANADHEKQRKRYGQIPDDMSGKTFAELEIIIFGNGSDAAKALDAERAQQISAQP